MKLNLSLRNRSGTFYLFLFFGFINIFYVNFFSVNIPHWDEWEFFNPGSLSWASLVAPHGEHFIVPSRLLTVSLFKLNLFNFRFLIFLNQLLWFFFLFYFYIFLRKKFEVDKWVTVSFLFFLTTLNSENQTWGFQNCFPLFLLFTFLGLNLILKKQLTNKSIIGISALLVLNMFTLSAGLVAGLGILLCLFSQLFIFKNEMSLKRKAITIALPLFCWLSGAFYFSKTILMSPAFPIKRTPPWDFEFWRYLLSLLSLGLGSENTSFYLLGLIPIAASVFLLFRIVQNQNDQKAKTLLFCFLVVFACLAAIAFGRASLGLIQSKSSRYAAISLLIIPLLFAALTLLKNLRVRRKLSISLFILLFLLNLNSLDYGAYARIYDDREESLKCVQQYYRGENQGNCPISYPGDLKYKLDLAKELEMGFTRL